MFYFFYIYILPHQEAALFALKHTQIDPVELQWNFSAGKSDVPRLALKQVLGDVERLGEFVPL